MEFKRKIIMRDEADTKEFGISLANNLKAGSVIGLIGELGTGKTTLSKYIAEGLGVKEPIKSPTFNIVLEYHSGRLPFYHFDLYRIEDEYDLFNIGYEEYFFGNGVSLVEWADRAIDIVASAGDIIEISYGKEDNERIYICTF